MMSPLEGDLRNSVVRFPRLGALLILFSAAIGLAVAGNAQDDVPDSHSAQILQKYLTAEESHGDALRGASMQVDIDASVPGLKEHGRLHALRTISKVGSVTYHAISFQGDNSIKKDVIARYLQAEQQGQGDQRLGITPTNYKFKYKGEKTQDNGDRVYVFQLSPRSKKVGLFKGVLWLDTKTYLPVMYKGRLVKNPSIFFKKVDFERDFTVQNGISVPKRISSTIDVRLIGKVELSINYSDFVQNGADTDEPQSAVLTGQASE